MKKLMNLAIASGMFTAGFDSDYDKVKAFVADHDLDGIEMILYGDYRVEEMPKELMVGHHLLYWPNWMDMWHDNREALTKEFLSEENAEKYYGTLEPQGMVDYYLKEFEVAKAIEAEYMVFHVAHASFEEVFTFNHRYPSRDVMAAAAELINQVFVGNGPLLLFENLWWPGLTYCDPELTRWFFSLIEYENKGLLLDISHLMATSRDISSEEEGVAYVHGVLDQLGDMAGHIKAIHLNKTIAGPYLSQDHGDRHRAFVGKKDLMEGFGMIYKHIHQIDSHQPFDHGGVNSIIRRIDPEWLVFELSAKTPEALGEMIDLQNCFLD